MIKPGVCLFAVMATFLSLNGFLFADTIMLDLTQEGSSGFIEGAFFQQISPQAAGSGNINPFLRLQGKGKGDEKGYNTSGEFEDGYDMKGGGKPGEDEGFTRPLMISELPLVSLEDILYREFLLDINESNGKGGDLLSLDALQIYQAGSGDLDEFSLIQANPLIYTLDKASDNWIGLNDALNPGSGAGDLLVYIPDSLFLTNPLIPYVYLYSQFGLQKGWESSGGFEEWAISENRIPIRTSESVQAPEPASLLLLGTGIIGLGLLATRRKKI